ncbi:bifunctional DNA primase/polymerase [Mycobacteroides abscessus]|uniref:bifunctional DNA primase/polymerase n=1 Tax=Mycobacteroides abscessus TaxID=36809 RepID=UPI0019D19C34|nr:bifunctional DNA primase/polymerase [Mycobacteroides abscessus]MBN7560305.1 bifunctional DNA primase/polymerase [Mycobacteroides abscessus subsp. abscessus]
MSASLPDVSGLSPFLAALQYAANGIAVAPFDPAKGRGKSCWNLVNHRDVTTDERQLLRWREQFGSFEAIATSPGQFGALVLDVDRPTLCPKHLRPVLAAAPYVKTRPDESPNRGHYWFALPDGLQMGNPALPFGEVRCVGGGIVLPPCGDRRTVRTGTLPVLPEALIDYLEPYQVQAEAGEAQGSTSVQQFCTTHQQESRPHKLAALLTLHRRALQRGRSEHDAMRDALRIGMGEARIGYVAARKVINALRACWPSARSSREFASLVSWAVEVAEGTNAETFQTISDRCPGTDTRQYS